MKLLLNTVQMALTLEGILTATSLAYDTNDLAGLYALVVKGLAGMLGNLKDANYGWSRWLVLARTKGKQRKRQAELSSRHGNIKQS
jgi:hypothetical protein